MSVLTLYEKVTIIRICHKMKDTKKIQEYYDTFLASEPGKHSSLDEFNARYNPILSFFDETRKHDLKILDVGCGTGVAAEKLMKFGTVCGIDVSPESIRLATDILDEAYVSTAEELPFMSGTFDVVVCTETMEHLLNPPKAISEFNRVLNPDGYLIISTPNPWYWLIILHKVYAKIRGRRTGTGQVTENYLPSPKLKNLIQGGGFRIIKFETVFFRPTFMWKAFKQMSSNFGLYQIYIVRKVVE